ncbi:hypothetical protein [Sulfitobacter sp. SH24]|uniref:hypothetical protein n=1 Tax=Sulfitobacter sp. SH24 TaxID=3421173 RepID=UPI003F50B9E2
MTNKNNLLFHYPMLSRPDLGLFRAPGPGLGNLLFPISRALIAQNSTGGTFIFPTMRQVKIGTFIRREKDKRTYGNLFRARTLYELIEWAQTSSLKHRLEGEVDPQARLVRYVGMGRQFHDLKGHREMVLGFLETAARLLPSVVQYDIAIHVRLGDFAPPRKDAAHVNTQVPLEWYRDAFAKAQSLCGNRPLKAILFSDDNPAEVIRELGIRGVEPEPHTNSLTSLILMSRARVLVGSRSTFSLWAQYLGDTHAIWPAEFELSKYKEPDAQKDLFV